MCQVALSYECGPEIPKKDDRIIIVSDYQRYTNSELRKLEDEYHVILVKNGMDAMRQIITEKPSLVIADVDLPEMSGVQLCSRIRSNFNVNDIPVILISHRQDEQEQLDSLDSLANDFLTLPISIELLKKKINNLLYRHQLIVNKYSNIEAEVRNIADINIKTQNEKLMDDILMVINDNLSDPTLSIETLSRQVGISRGHLYRKFKEIANETPHDYIRDVRLKQAARLLSEERQTISSVMYACGFRNASSFSRMFKEAFGQSPTEYMKH